MGSGQCMRRKQWMHLWYGEDGMAMVDGTEAHDMCGLSMEDV